ncbi:MAG: helix-turn-helix transcriptional regulator [Oscillospiraceae bacterium]|nr:helix-turn-helix transcriptional regulator [Oscillospiraceae bacterium]
MGKIMSDRLKNLRKNMGKTQQQAADEMFMSRTTLAKYENPDTDFDSMRAKELLILANYYDCDPRFITGDISCKDKEISDIHDATGLSVEAISVLSTMKKYNDDKHDPISPLILDFISQLITDVDFFVVERHIRAMVDVETFEDIAKEQHHKEIRDALELRLLAEIDAGINPSTDILEFLSSLKSIEDRKNSIQDIVDATAFRFSHDVTKVLDSFSEKHMPIVREQIQREQDELLHGYEEYRKRG